MKNQFITFKAPDGKIYTINKQYISCVSNVQGKAVISLYVSQPSQMPIGNQITADMAYNQFIAILGTDIAN